MSVGEENQSPGRDPEDVQGADNTRTTTTHVLRHCIVPGHLFLSHGL